MSTMETPVIDEKIASFPSRSGSRLVGEKSVGASGDETFAVVDPATGNEPDPRFTLANERTLLAWNRTSLALIGGGLAANQLIDFSSVAGRLAVSMTPVILGAVLAIVSLRRWIIVQRALRAGAPLPMPHTAVVLVVGICVLGAAFVLSMVLDAITG
jgi:putative membrane protein